MDWLGCGLGHRPRFRSRTAMAPPMAVAMRGWIPAHIAAHLLWPWWLAISHGAQAQSGDGEALDVPLVAVAWDAGCLTRDECAVLAAAFRDQPLGVWTQQAVASELPPSRSAQVLACLRHLPEWQDAFRRSAQSPVRPLGSILRCRADLIPSASVLSLSYRNKGRSGGDLGFRTTLREGQVELESAHLKAAGMRGHWWCGTLAAGFGQGLVVWTPSPFDDIGGMEGSHRIGRGIRPASFRQRGIWNGFGWQENPAFSRRWRPSWCVMGKAYPDQKRTAALGGRIGRLEWAGRIQELLEGGWQGLAGIHGGSTGKGWSLRWAAAAFREGWVGRLSALKTWSRHWEAHAQFERDHPLHPKWHSGEMRATPMDPEALPGMLWKGGMAFRGHWSGWVRMEVRWWGPPPHRTHRRTALRIERNGHRLDIKTWIEPGEPFQAGNGALGGGHWSVLWRKLYGPIALDAPVWRWCISAAGKDHSVGMALAFMVSWRTPVKGRWKLGVAQSWGAEGAPIRYVQGWDGRPSEPFSKAGVKAFVRWRSASGAWNLRVRLGWPWGAQEEDRGGLSHGIHAVRVEFKPSWPSTRHG